LQFLSKRSYFQLLFFYQRVKCLSLIKDGVTGRWYGVSPFSYENLYAGIRNFGDVWHLETQEARGAFIPHPCVSDSDLAASCFSDSYFARNYVDGGGQKYNPRARQVCPNVHTPAVRVTALAAPFAAETATASLLIRRRRDNPAHATLAAGGVHLCVNEAKAVAMLKMLAQNCPAEICDQSDSMLA
jgi:hypothetical protein